MKYGVFFEEVKSIPIEVEAVSTSEAIALAREEWVKMFAVPKPKTVQRVEMVRPGPRLVSLDWVIGIESPEGTRYVKFGLDGEIGSTLTKANAERFFTEDEARESYFAFKKKYPEIRFKYPTVLDQ